MSDYKEAVLPNGLRILAHRMPDASSVAACYYILSGTRDEEESLVGGAHFLEHMLFRGSERYSAQSIRRLVRDWGAEINAFTWWEATCYHVRTLPSLFPEAFEMLTDMVRFPLLHEEDAARECGVIEEEIARQADSPRVQAMYELYKSLYKNSTLGRVGIGTVEQVRRLTGERLRGFHQRHYIPANALVVISGQFDWSTLEDVVTTACTDWAAGPGIGLRAPVAMAGPASVRITAPALTRSHMAWGWEAPALRDSDHYAAQILAVLLGDETGMGSRLFWSLKARGLTDRIQAIYTGLDGTGLFCVYATGAPERGAEIQAGVLAELHRLSAAPPTRDELNRAKRKLISRLLVEAETSDMRMFGLARTWLINGQMLTLQQVIQQLESVDQNDLVRILERFPVSRTLTNAVLDPAK